MNDFLEIDRMTLYEYEIRMKAYRLRRVDIERDIHLQAWANSQARATKKSGKPFFSKFKDFFNYKNAEKRALEAVKSKGESKLANLVAEANK